MSIRLIPKKYQKNKKEIKMATKKKNNKKLENRKVNTDAAHRYIKQNEKIINHFFQLMKTLTNDKKNRDYSSPHRKNKEYFLDDFQQTKNYIKQHFSHLSENMNLIICDFLNKVNQNLNKNKNKTWSPVILSDNLINAAYADFSMNRINYGIIDKPNKMIDPKSKTERQRKDVVISLTEIKKIIARNEEIPSASTFIQEETPVVENFEKLEKEINFEERDYKRENAELRRKLKIAENNNAIFQLQMENEKLSSGNIV